MELNREKLLEIANEAEGHAWMELASMRLSETACNSVSLEERAKMRAWESLADSARLVASYMVQK